MKPPVAIKPLVFALTAILAMRRKSVAATDHQIGHHNGHNGSHSAPLDLAAVLLLQLQTTAG